MSNQSDLDAVRTALSEVYKPEGVELWLNAAHPMLDDFTPMQLIDSGDVGRVLQVVEMLASGAFG